MMCGGKGRVWEELEFGFGIGLGLVWFGFRGQGLGANEGYLISQEISHELSLNNELGLSQTTGRVL